MPKTIKKTTEKAEKPVTVKVTEKAEKPAKTVKVATAKAPKKAAKAATKPEVEAEDMLAPSEEKMEVITQFQVKEGDTGSPEVQAALLTKRIEKLVLHLKSNPGDNHSRRGLLGIVSKRRRLLNYLESRDKDRYKDVLKKLGLSK